ncbi:helix-turn-helix transcriptional regulator [Oceanospirillum beijerinckii]|uniref:helix-turn-helix transcriptional regulator n=1 Tax=Oceanospirillum beijerinckii TaxID=64976 RepID=UPI00041C66B2|nr:helix-turn-helix transcriptional regulator [Oceanospirillum beijerinckii]
MTIGERLKEVREALGMTQEELGNKCGVTMRSQRNYERGKQQPDAQYLKEIALLEIDVAYILTGEKKEAPITGMHPEQIKADIRIAGTTPAKIAEELGVTRSTVSQVIHGRGTSERIQQYISEVIDKPVSLIWAPRELLARKYK